METLRAAASPSLRAELLGPLLVRGQQVLGLLLLAERLAVEEEVLLPGDADLLGEDGRRDGGQLVVELLLAELAAQDQVRLERVDRLQVGLGEHPDLLDAGELVRAEVGRPAPRLTGGGGADRCDAE